MAIETWGDWRPRPGDPTVIRVFCQTLCAAPSEADEEKQKGEQCGPRGLLAPVPASSGLHVKEIFSPGGAFPEGAAPRLRESVGEKDTLRRPATGMPVRPTRNAS